MVYYNSFSLRERRAKHFARRARKEKVSSVSQGSGNNTLMKYQRNFENNRNNEQS